MTARELILDLHLHMEWADATMWRAVLASGPAAADDDALERLRHIHLVQRAFLSVWRGEPVDRRGGEGLAPAELARWAQGGYGVARAHLAGVDNTLLGRPVEVPWTAEVGERLGFLPAPTTLGETALQVALHTAHHRGQVASRLRRLGVTPPLVDYIGWLWQGRPRPHWP